MLFCHESGLDPVSDLEFLQDVGHVVFDRFFLQVEFPADLFVA
jgi:hypothetical protein